MIRASIFSSLALAVACIASPAWAQQSARNQLQSGFDAKAPAIGQELPDASGYTADGEPLNLRELRGKYTVIVFGCLT